MNNIELLKWYYDSTDKESRTSTPSGLSVFSKFYLQKIVLMIFHVTCSLSFFIDTNGIGFKPIFFIFSTKGVMENQ
nr:MAG: hypothetical protein [Bacteriophage sp.]